MKIVTNDYGCGTSSSILDYGLNDVIVVSEQNYSHVFEEQDDLFFVGHDFLFYLWNDEEKLKKWIDRSKKFEHWLWCFERIDAIIPVWRQKSHTSLAIASKFCKRILACDEDDCDLYKIDWMPQWASKKFFEKKNTEYKYDKILFSGQAGLPEYHIRNNLLKEISQDEQLRKDVVISNVKRDLSWDQYVDNLLQYSKVLNPVGVLKALNTRAYEALYSNRILLQHTSGTYKRHEAMLKNNSGILFFQDVNQLKRKLNSMNFDRKHAEESYSDNSIYARFKSIGIDIK